MGAGGARQCGVDPSDTSQEMTDSVDRTGGVGEIVGAVLLLGKGLLSAWKAAWRVSHGPLPRGPAGGVCADPGESGAGVEPPSNSSR